MAPSLPTEIIQLIIHELDPDAADAVSTAITVSAISRHWRAAALSTPSLWSTFSFRLRSRHTPMLAAFLEPSRLAPLHITISLCFKTAAQTRSAKVQRALALLRGPADRVVQLRLLFVDCMSESDVMRTIRELIGFTSIGMKYLEMELLHNEDSLCPRALHAWHVHGLFRPQGTECWSDLCPALTHITTTDPELLLYSPTKLTSLRLKAVPGRRNTVNYGYLRALLDETKALLELILDGVSLERVDADQVTLPHLCTLSVRSAPSPHRDISSEDAYEMACFLTNIDARALTSLAVTELNVHIPVIFKALTVSMPSITRLAIVPGSSRPLFYYPTALPNVEVLVLLGSDPRLYGIAGLSAVAWPHLRIIDLSELEPTPPENIQLLWERLYWYGHRRFEAGHDSRLEVQMPRGVTPGDMPLDVGEFMDLHTA